MSAVPGVARRARPYAALPAAATTARRWDLDRGKSLGVILVVLGHLVAREDPPGLLWYEPLRATLYDFHIPFLFYLSGYVSHLAGSDRRAGTAYRALLRRRAARLLLPALLLGLGILAGKTVLAPHLAVDHAPESIGAGLRALVWDTVESPAQSVWYLIALFAFVAVTPPLMRWFGEVPLVGLAGLLFLLPVPPLFYADRMAGNYVFFLCGLTAACREDGWLAALDRYRRPLVAALLVALGLDIAAHALPAPPPRWITQTTMSLLAIPALHALLRHSAAGRLAAVSGRVLDWLAPYGFAIYLLNTVAIGLAKALLLRHLPWTAANFPIFATVLLAAGILGPVAAKRLLRPLPALDRLTS